MRLEFPSHTNRQLATGALMDAGYDVSDADSRFELTVAKADDEVLEIVRPYGGFVVEDDDADAD